MEENYFLKQVEKEAALACRQVLAQAKLKENDLFVVGCSSSEILGEKIGTHSSLEAATAAFTGIWNVLKENHIDLAAQCCEHLNRALIVEEETMERYGLEQVNVIPQVNHAGGAFATAAYNHFSHPVAVESLNARASAGMDIGATLIGMHIHPVAVPVRIEQKKIGNAILICARRRPKYVGGQRATYDPKLL